MTAGVWMTAKADALGWSVWVGQWDHGRHRRSAHRLIADFGVDGRGDCFPPLLLRSDGEDAPFAGHALELVRAAVFELES